MADGHLRATYNEIHTIIGKASEQIASFQPDLFVAIGGGGFFPARVLRSFLKHPTTGKNISIQAIGLSLYEELPGVTEEQLGKEVVRTQWLGPESRVLLGRRVLIIVSL
ncbi:hypoxanthine-guanine phosphoribosyltransferase [Tulasnella sp. 419]|nr:hypoxanthine-guanine phosphoribosyltransferase [Tulasnella sp. 419]